MALRDFYRTNLPLSSDPNVDTYIDVPLVSVNLVTNGVDAFTYTFDADFDVEFGDPAPTAEQVEMAMAGFTGEDDPEVAVFANFLAQTIYADIQPDRSIGGLVFVYPFQPTPFPTPFPTKAPTRQPVSTPEPTQEPTMTMTTAVPVNFVFIIRFSSDELMENPEITEDQDAVCCFVFRDAFLSSCSARLLSLVAS